MDISPDEFFSLCIHQNLIPISVLKRAEKKLHAKAREISQAKSFDKLHDVVKQTITPIVGIGDLAVYDFALRIGARPKLHPTKIYLHRGTRDGAKALGLGGRTIAQKELPKEFWSLTPPEIEDCLCIFKDDIRKIVKRQRGGHGRQHAPHPPRQGGEKRVVG